MSTSSSSEEWVEIGPGHMLRIKELPEFTEAIERTLPFRRRVVAVKLANEHERKMYFAIDNVGFAVVAPFLTTYRDMVGASMDWIIKAGQGHVSDTLPTYGVTRFVRLATDDEIRQLDEAVTSGQAEVSFDWKHKSVSDTVCHLAKVREHQSGWPIQWKQPV